MHPDGKQLEKLGKLVADKKLKVRLDKEFDFDDLQTACDYVATGHANGKVIIDVMG
ncbi:zinc-binding dehydrogenase [Ligilactobacillus salivarius]|uniref:zinc-binding dehydrogenase n=1 Tax=Ligilactobacillus salivarius TaxID=1624 RepID=UPI0020236FEE|nr:zinc-binding dehydrogenase [Ligilactobacillus salivarius]URI12211.1 zinc-binding dehydrogenase [Ligilactobacillus salivarius]UUB34033.1 zinc-binding dehydrogenase [Ligilactobacillus salivarius]